MYNFGNMFVRFLVWESLVCGMTGVEPLDVSFSSSQANIIIVIGIVIIISK
jgi:hypothetical protein